LVSNSCGIYEDIKRFLTGNVQKLKFFHTTTAPRRSQGGNLC
jgi:hypothetical protein